MTRSVLFAVVVSWGIALILPAPTRADQVVCVADGMGHDACDVLLPDVLHPSTTYTGLQFQSGDQVTVSGSGCVQTGGKGNTWKRYVDPDPQDPSSNTRNQYHGLVSIPGATTGPWRLNDPRVAGQTLVSTGGSLSLGYEDDPGSYDDNGYYNHDDGTGDQCADQTDASRGRAKVHLDITRATAPFAARGTTFGQCVPDGTGAQLCRIDRPDVTVPTEDYPSVRFNAGDVVTVAAGGCVQTGGGGNTWKAYVNPDPQDTSSNAPDHLYHGLISIPGATPGLVRISSVLGTTQPLRASEGSLRLGYEDDAYDDNGYYTHDDGVAGQCAGESSAWLEIRIRHGRLPRGMLSFDGMEVTQSVQDMDQSVPLVTGKTTWVRAYLSGLPNQQATASLRIHSPLSGTTVTVAPVAPLTITADSFQVRRGSWTGSLNFLVPSSVTAGGPWNFQLLNVADATGRQFSCRGCDAIVPASFLSSPKLKVKFILLSYSAKVGGVPTVFTPREADLLLAQSWLARAYPTAGIEWSVTSVMADKSFTPPFSNDTTSCSAAGAQVAKLRGNDFAGMADSRVHYYGLVADSSATVAGGFMRGCTPAPADPDPSVTGAGPAGPGAQSPVQTDHDGSYADWYTGHELGHSFGRTHPDFCGAPGPNDTNFPYPNGHISDDLGTFAGLDVGDKLVDTNGNVVLFIPPPAGSVPYPLSVLPGTSTSELMTYCVLPQWPSAYTYERIRQRLIDEDRQISSEGAGAPSAGPGAESGAIAPFIHVVATVDDTALTGKITSVFPVERAEPQRQRIREATLQSLDGRGKVLASTPVELRLESDQPPKSHRLAIVDASIPVTKGMVAIRLALRDKTIDEFKSSFRPVAPPSDPILDRTKPAPRLDVPSIRLHWTPSPSSNSERITYIVEKFGEGGRLETVGIGITEPSLLLSTTDAKADLRIIATNGFRNSPPADLRGR